MKKWELSKEMLGFQLGNLNRIQFGIGPSASEKKRTQKTGSISFLNIFFMKWIQILLIIIMKWIQCWKPLVCIVFSVVLYQLSIYIPWHYSSFVRQKRDFQISITHFIFALNKNNNKDMMNVDIHWIKNNMNSFHQNGLVFF